MFKSIIVFIFLVASIFFISLLDPLLLPRHKNGENFETAFMKQDLKPTSNLAQWVSIENMSPILICAVVKAEDRKFFRHFGLDFDSIYKASIKWYRDNKLLGASTITQQLAKNLYGNKKRSWKSKVVETWYAVKLELTYTKSEILEYYLNSIEWGEGIWGITRASEVYFSKNIIDLEIEESIFLATLIASPLSQSDSRQIKRMSSLYDRINHQLYASGLYEYNRMIQIKNTWSNLQLKSTNRGNHNRQNISSNIIPVLSLKQALDSECGLDQELLNEK